MFDNVLYIFSKNKNINSLKKYNMTGIFAFNTDEQSYKILIKDEEFQKGLTYEYNNISLYHCICDKCFKTKGYLKYNYNKLIGCNSTCQDNNIFTYNCGDDKFRPYLDENELKLCINQGNSNHQNRIIKTIDGTEKFLFNYLKNGNEYNLFITNSNNIIGYSSQCIYKNI